MIKHKIINLLQELTGHKHIEIVSRGNTAIDSAMYAIEKGKTILIPEEGGWLHYRIAAEKQGLKVSLAKCNQAKIDLAYLQQKLADEKVAALIYQNPGGYFAEQPFSGIYDLCRKNKCLVIVDVSGALGTKLCQGNFADIMVGSFGKWKLVEARVGGFISCNDENLRSIILSPLNLVTDEVSLLKIRQKLEELPQRIKYLSNLRKKVIESLANFNLQIVHPQDMGFVVVVKPRDILEREKVINYCIHNQLEWTEGPRYVRLNEPIISIEIKRKL